MGNQIEARLVSGKQKKDPSKTWQGLSVEAIVDGKKYSGLIFQEFKSTSDTIKFDVIK